MASPFYSLPPRPNQNSLTSAISLAGATRHERLWQVDSTSMALPPKEGKSGFGRTECSTLAACYQWGGNGDDPLTTPYDLLRPLTTLTTLTTSYDPLRPPTTLTRTRQKLVPQHGRDGHWSTGANETGTCCFNSHHARTRDKLFTSTS